MFRDVGCTFERVTFYFNPVTIEEQVGNQRVTVAKAKKPRDPWFKTRFNFWSTFLEHEVGTTNTKEQIIKGKNYCFFCLFNVKWQIPSRLMSTRFMFLFLIFLPGYYFNYIYFLR